MIPLGIGVFLCANLLYARWRREDEPDAVRRAVAFFLGFPTTFLIFLLVETDTELAWERRERIESRDSDPEAIERELERELTQMRRRGRLLILLAVPLLGGCDITFHGGPESLEFTVAAGGLVSIAAMVLYYRYRRSGEPSGLKRFLTFLAGLPMTFFIMLAVEEDPEEVFRRIDGDDDAYDLARLEGELEAFRAHKEALEAKLRLAPPPHTGLASEPRVADPDGRTRL